MFYPTIPSKIIPHVLCWLKLICYFFFVNCLATLFLEISSGTFDKARVKKTKSGPLLGILCKMEGNQVRHKTQTIVVAWYLQQSWTISGEEGKKQLNCLLLYCIKPFFFFFFFFSALQFMGMTLRNASTAANWFFKFSLESAIKVENSRLIFPE